LLAPLSGSLSISIAAISNNWPERALDDRTLRAFPGSLFTHLVIYLPSPASHWLKKERHLKYLCSQPPIYYVVIHKCSYMSQIAPGKSGEGQPRGWTARARDHSSIVDSRSQIAGDSVTGCLQTGKLFNHFVRFRTKRAFQRLIDWCFAVERQHE